MDFKVLFICLLHLSQIFSPRKWSRFSLEKREMREETVTCTYHELSICLYEIILDLSSFTLFCLQLFRVVKQSHTVTMILKLLSDGEKANFQRKCGLFLDTMRKNFLIPEYYNRESSWKSVLI